MLMDCVSFSHCSPRALTLELIRQRTLPRDLLESGNQELMSVRVSVDRGIASRR